jgi:hypothetical protein
MKIPRRLANKPQKQEPITKHLIMHWTTIYDLNTVLRMDMGTRENGKIIELTLYFAPLSGASGYQEITVNEKDHTKLVTHILKWNDERLLK